MTIIYHFGFEFYQMGICVSPILLIISSLNTHDKISYNINCQLNDKKTEFWAVHNFAV